VVVGGTAVEVSEQYEAIVGVRGDGAPGGVTLRCKEGWGLVSVAVARVGLMSWRNGDVWWCSRGGWRYGWWWRKSTTVMLGQGGESPKVADAQLLCGVATWGVGAGVVLQVGWARGALASSSQPRGRQWRSGARSAAGVVLRRQQSSSSAGRILRSVEANGCGSSSS
jgi:hypothetical protein